MQKKTDVISLVSLEGTHLFVDPNFVAYVECRGPVARLVFSGGFELPVRDPMGAVAYMLRAAKEGEQFDDEMIAAEPQGQS